MALLYRRVRQTLTEQTLSALCLLLLIAPLASCGTPQPLQITTLNLGAAEGDMTTEDIRALDSSLQQLKRVLHRHTQSSQFLPDSIKQLPIGRSSTKCEARHSHSSHLWYTNNTM